MKAKVKRRKLPIISILGLAIVISIIWLLIVRFEGEAPSVQFYPPLPILNASQVLSFSVSDDKNGLAYVRISLLKDGKEAILFQKDYPGLAFFRGGAIKEDKIELQIEPTKLDISDGDAMLQILVRDFSWRRWGNGNKTYIEKTVKIDTQPPEVEVLSSVHNLTQGGAGLVIYRISEASAKSGIQLGENYFPGYSGYFNDKSIVIAFIALNYDQGPGTEMYVKAFDLAGNSTRIGFPHYIRKQTFPKDVINISDSFLNWKMPEFNIEAPPGTEAPMVQKFLRVNREVRAVSFEKIKKIGDTTDPTLYWKDTFLRLPGSSRQAGFADSRDYRYQGQIIDKQIHQGIDLASVVHSSVPSSNSGKVAFAGSIGIYGKTVIIDHGFGLFSTYSHLSGYDVEKGQMVAKGEIIGRTGTTGLAGGDHLHFGILIHHTFVNPIEWWDSSWIKNNIQSKLDILSSIYP